MTRERSPALIASLALHLALVAATMITWPWAKELKVGSVVPINIVSSAPPTGVSQAVQAEEVLEAQTEEPVPEAPPPEPLPPPPAPQPAPAPTPAPKATPPKATQPAPKKPTPKTEKSSTDFLDSLAADVAKISKTQKSSGARGPTRPATAQQAQPDAGAGLSAIAMAGLTEELQKNWNPNCTVEGGREVKVRVTFTVAAGGRVVGKVTAGGLERSSDPIVQAAADRAIRAVYQASPLERLPSSYRGQITANFNPRDVCF
jgi:periplasmic protein TonB